MMFQKYIIIYDNGFSFFTTENAVSFKSCLIQFLDYTGNNKPLIRKALNGMETEKEMVDLINIMTSETIQYIHKIEQTIYEPQKK